MIKKQPSLTLCLILDAVGCLSYAIPGFGEMADIVWAPVSGFIFFLMFGSWRGALFNFTEEILPGLDFIPSFTIAWFLRYFSRKAATARPSGLMSCSRWL